MNFAHSGRPFLGICVGMQLLFDVGEEMGEWPGLGLVPGRVVKFKFDGAPATSNQQPVANSQPPPSSHPLKIPHIGWNQVEQCADHPILRDVTPDGYAYFVHSFHAKTAEPSYTITTTHYGYDFPSVVAKDNVWGIQFHPEKSQDVGLQMLKNFIDV